jgi:hypothetical protein
MNSNKLQAVAENAPKGLSVVSKYKDYLDPAFRKTATSDSRSLEHVSAENAKLKEELKITKECWDIDKRVLGSKVEALEAKLKEGTLSDISDLQTRLEASELRASNQEIEAHKYEQLFKAAKEELQLCKPLVEVGAAVRQHFLNKAGRKLATWYSTQATYKADSKIRAAGEKASNEPNARADLALYQCGFLDANTITEAKKFTELYKVDARAAIDQYLFESKSQVELWNLRGELFKSTKSRLGGKVPFFDPIPYINAFLKLDQEITLLCPKSVEEGKLILKEGEEPAEDPQVWEKIEELRRILTVLGTKDA